MVDKKTNTSQKSRGLSSVYQWVARVVGSKAFFVVVLILILVQSSWYALSFKTSQFDEVFHFDFITMYTETKSPFINDQKQEWDKLGETTRYPSYLYHYTMSFPLRIVQQITEVTSHQVIALRITSIIFFVLGLVLYKRLLEKLGTSKAATNLILLLVVLTPNISILAGTINYDNMIFLLSALLLLAAVKLTREKRPNFVSLVAIISISLLASLIKFTFLAFFMPVLLFILIHQYKIHGANIWRLYLRSFKKLGILAKVSILLLLIVSTGLVLERHGYNLIKYREPKPSCQIILPEERCEANFVANRNIELLTNKPPEFLPAPPTWYTGIWLQSITSTSIRTVQKEPAPLMLGLLYIFVLPAGILALLICAREFVKTPTDRMIFYSILIYVGVVFVYNYLLYVRYGQTIAMNGRYLLPVAPLLLMYIYRAFNILVNKKYASTIKLISLAIVLLCFTQGGGLLMHLISTNNKAYWDNEVVISVNEKAKNISHKLIYERSIFSK